MTLVSDGLNFICFQGSELKETFVPPGKLLQASNIAFVGCFDFFIVNNKHVLSDDDCPLMDAGSQRIPRLTVKVTANVKYIACSMYVKYVICCVIDFVDILLTNTSLSYSILLCLLL